MDHRETQCYTLQETSQKLQPSASMITNAEERRGILTHLAQLYNIPRVTSFPGGHPTTIARPHVARMHAERCMFALKTDGVRYLLLLCTVQDAFRAVMIDRCLRMFEVVIYASEEFFERRTLLDGELVLDHRTNCLCYQAFDVVCMRGRYFHEEPYNARLQAIHDRVLSELPPRMREDSEEAENHIIEEDKIYASRTNHMSMSILPKRFVTATNARTLWEQRHKSPFPTDGLIINFDDSPIRCGTLRSVMKWKPHNAIDVRIDVANKMAVMCRNAGVDERLAKITFQGRSHRVVLEDNHLIQWLLHRKGEQSYWLIECLVEVKDGCATLWPMKERSDKTEANDIKVIQSTLDTISENVSLDELFPAERLASDCAEATMRRREGSEITRGGGVTDVVTGAPTDAPTHAANAPPSSKRHEAGSARRRGGDRGGGNRGSTGSATGPGGPSGPGSTRRTAKHHVLPDKETGRGRGDTADRPTRSTRRRVGAKADEGGTAA